ncbi:hypothetical protein [Pseudarthrobacter sp. N5]|uniref:hypothetical protein n=1 Tax=Pseudarthrobacter sp. N5 TaxID=3418416 RepID=UPI003CF9A0A0
MAHPAAAHPTTAPLAAPPAHVAAPSTQLHHVRVIPGVDITLGTVTFVVNDLLERHWFHEPRLIARALAQAVRPARWCPEAQILTLTVAAAGHRAGVEKHFSFAPAVRGLPF